MTDDVVAAFIEAACVPMDSGHASGTLDRAQAILAAHPEIAHNTIHVAAIHGEDAAVRRFLDLDATNATLTGEPRGWDALTYLCFSRYLRLDRARAGGFVRAARALLDAGASANTGFYSDDHQPPEFESVLYGAAGVAHDVRACVDSYWMGRRSPESVAALIGAGASVSGVNLPTGYADVDKLLWQTRGRT